MAQAGDLIGRPYTELSVGTWEYYAAQWAQRARTGLAAGWAFQPHPRPLSKVSVYATQRFGEG